MGDRAGVRRKAQDSGEKLLTRVQLDMPPEAIARLRDLQQRTGATSYAEVVRTALKTYERLLRMQEAGELLTVRNGRTTREVEFWLL